MTSSPEAGRELSPEARREPSPEAGRELSAGAELAPEADRELPGPGTAGPAGAEQPGDLDLADRHALRRVAGLSTELADGTEVEYRALRLERVVLVGVWTEGTLASAENSLRELSRLAETAGSVILAGLVQRRGKPDPATYIGAGKARELAGVVAETGADTVICDGALTPGQLRSLEGMVRACWAKMSRIRAVRSMTLTRTMPSRLRSWPGVSSPSQITVSAPVSVTTSATSRALPAPM